MSEPFIAEIRIFASNFAPRGWAECDGQTLPIAQNTALFSILGTTYGGDGRSTLGLPDLRGRAPMHPGRGPGLTSRRLGERGGASAVALTSSDLPVHDHGVLASSDTSNTGSPVDAALGNATAFNRYGPANDLEDMNAAVLANTGGAGHNNLQPFLVVTFIIALVGLFPSRN